MNNLYRIFVLRGTEKQCAEYLTKSLNKKIQNALKSNKIASMDVHLTDEEMVLLKLTVDLFDWRIINF